MQIPKVIAFGCFGLAAVIYYAAHWPGVSSPPEPPRFQRNNFCTKDDKAVEAHHENFTGNRFTQPLYKSCWLKIYMPPQPQLWHFRQMDESDAHFEMYMLTINHGQESLLGPYHWRDNDVQFSPPSVFWIQATRDDEAMLFERP